jgi:hypothetical protein
MFRISALERVDYSKNFLKEKLSRLIKLRWPLAWLVVCRNPIDVNRRTVVVDDNNSRFDDLAQCCSVGALHWKRSGFLGFRNLNDCSSKDAGNKYNVFRLILFPQVELENMFLILVSLRKIVFLSLIFSPCQGLKANLELFGIKN